MSRSNQVPTWARISRSVATRSVIPGRNTFTATLLPSDSRAAWTCATEALATGTGSNEAKTVSSGLAYCSSRVDFTWSKGNPGTSSCSFRSSIRSSSGRRSGRLENICPIFTNVGPNDSQKKPDPNPSAVGGRQPGRGSLPSAPMFPPSSREPKPWAATCPRISPVRSKTERWGGRSGRGRIAMAMVPPTFKVTDPG